MSTYESEQIQAVQGVVDRVSSYQDGAPESTVEQELRSGLEEVGVSVPDADVAKLVDAIEADAGEVDASSVLS